MNLHRNTKVKVVHCPVGCYNSHTGEVKCIDRDDRTPILVHFDSPVTDNCIAQEESEGRQHWLLLSIQGQRIEKTMTFQELEIGDQFTMPEVFGSYVLTKKDSSVATYNSDGLPVYVMPDEKVRRVK